MNIHTFTKGPAGSGCEARLRPDVHARADPALCSAVQAEQSRRFVPSRKVRTSQGKVVGNADPGKPAGKCHRNDTA